MNMSPRAGEPATASDRIDIPKLITAYYTHVPDPSIPDQRVSFGTSGHRGSSFSASFNESHILAISQAICDYRSQARIAGPLYLGIDTHALSTPACATALEVLSANSVTVILAENDEFTPTPVISHAILTHNRVPTKPRADGIVITPSHNPPDQGGFKYNPPTGGPANLATTQWIETRANELLSNGLQGLKRIPYEKAQRVNTTHRQNLLQAYVRDLGNVLDMDAIRQSGVHIGVDPLGGAGAHYWGPIAEYYGLHLEVVRTSVDPTFAFMTLDWDGRIRMDPSSPYAMRSLISQKDRFDVTVACDTDHDRHGVITRTSGLLPPNHYLSVAIQYLFSHRKGWSSRVGIGKTLVSSRMIDRVAAALNRSLYEVPVGFKWFVEGLLNGSLGFVGEESAGATFLRKDGSVWTTDKDGILLALLAAEIQAVTGKDPGALYQELTSRFGDPVYDRIEAPATPQQKALLKNLSPKQVHDTRLAGEKILSVLTTAPGNGEPIGGLKVGAKNGWFAARPSGTENLYKIYAESFRGQQHLEQILGEAETIVQSALMS